MIRFRERHSGAEATWDPNAGGRKAFPSVDETWSGDAGLIATLRMAGQMEHVVSGCQDSLNDVQARMARRFPQYGVVVVEETRAVEMVHEPGVVY